MPRARLACRWIHPALHDPGPKVGMVAGWVRCYRLHRMLCRFRSRLLNRWVAASSIRQNRAESGIKFNSSLIFSMIASITGGTGNGIVKMEGPAKNFEIGPPCWKYL